MVIIINCRICGREWVDERYEKLLKRGIDVGLRTCCNECVEEVFKRDKLLSPVSE